MEFLEPRLQRLTVQSGKHVSDSHYGHMVMDNLANLFSSPPGLRALQTILGSRGLIPGT